MIEPSSSEKLQVFEKGGHIEWDAKFPVPPVHITMWEPEDWINWVDHKGFWFRKVKEEKVK